MPILTERNTLDQQHSGRVIGLFSKDTMPVAWRGTTGRIVESIERSWLNHIHEMIGSITQPQVIECGANPSVVEMPSMETMTQYALDRLSRDNDKGFFFTIESASIDKKSHEREACCSIGEIKQLEEALAVAMDYASDNPNTLIIVTADHSQAAQIMPDPILYTSLPIPVFSPGKMASIATPEGSVTRINYATNNISSEEHTGANVSLFANSEGESVLSPFISQRDIYDAMMRYLEL